MGEAFERCEAKLLRRSRARSMMLRARTMSEMSMNLGSAEDRENADSIKQA